MIVFYKIHVTVKRVLASSQWSQGNLWYILGRLPQLSLSYGGPEGSFTIALPTHMMWVRWAQLSSALAPPSYHVRIHMPHNFRYGVVSPSSELVAAITLFSFFFLRRTEDHTQNGLAKVVNSWRPSSRGSCKWLVIGTNLWFLGI